MSTNYANEPPQSRVEFLLSQGGGGSAEDVAQLKLRVAVLEGDAETVGSILYLISEALEDENLDGIRTRLTILEGDSNTNGSVAKTVNDAVTSLINGAPGSLDTLKEISDWIDSHEDISDALTTAVNTLNGNVATPGSVAKAVADGIASLQAAINTLNGNASTPGSVAKAIADEDIQAIRDAIATLNGSASTNGSVAKTVKDAIDALVDSAPSSYDTLKEISDWIAENEDALSWTKYSA